MQTTTEKRFHSSYRQELYYIQLTSSLVTNEGIRIRLMNLLLWYIREAERAKIKYYFFKMVTILLPALVMIITSSGTGLAIWASEEWGTAANLLVAVLAGFTNIASSILVVTKWHENWIQYRRTADKIEGELALYLAGAYPYRNPALRDGRLMQKVERIASQEDDVWVETMMREQETNATQTEANGAPQLEA